MTGEDTDLNKLRDQCWQQNATFVALIGRIGHHTEIIRKVCRTDTEAVNDIVLEELDAYSHRVREHRSAFAEAVRHYLVCLTELVTAPDSASLAQEMYDKLVSNREALEVIYGHITGCREILPRFEPTSKMTRAAKQEALDSIDQITLDIASGIELLKRKERVFSDLLS